MPESSVKVFDREHAQNLARAKKYFLNLFLPQLIKTEKIKSAIDVGCGLGYFSGYLRDLGLSVSAFDARAENIKEAKSRFPEIEFSIFDIESPILTKIATPDFVLCLGLLYHLENPFSAIRNLAKLTQKICIIETIISPYFKPNVSFLDECAGDDQGLNYIAQIPSRSWLIKTLYESGFNFIYNFLTLPEHQDFRNRFFMHRKRIFILASKESLNYPFLKVCPVPRLTGRYMWYRFVGDLLENRRLRGLAKAILRK